MVEITKLKYEPGYIYFIHFQVTSHDAFRDAAKIAIEKLKDNGFPAGSVMFVYQPVDIREIKSILRIDAYRDVFKQCITPQLAAFKISSYFDDDPEIRALLERELDLRRLNAEPAEKK